MKKIYIILSHSGSMPSRIIKFFTLFKYSHVSIALKKDLRVMYSFGRKKLNNPFDGGFITEDKNGLFYKKFYKTKCIILEIDVNLVACAIEANSLIILSFLSYYITGFAQLFVFIVYIFAYFVKQYEALTAMYWKDNVTNNGGYLIPLIFPLFLK